jgi:predicted glutamine amidotransferase
MCGLVGLAGDCSGVWKDVFSELLMMDSVRGLHSTGAGFVDRLDDSFMLAKKPGNPWNLFNSDEYKAALDPKNCAPKVILGHNRYATRGEHTEANAHPFAFKNIIGMHNGTLDTWAIKKLHDHEKFGTDSEAIFAHMDKYGVDETIKHLSGAWALVWYNKKENTINFLRNDKRPLNYCYSQDRCTLLWASEFEMIKYVMNRRNKKIHDDNFYAVTKDTLFTWTVPHQFTQKFGQPEQAPMEGEKWVYQAAAPFEFGTEKKKNGTANTQTSGASAAYANFNKRAPKAALSYFERLNTKKFRPPYKDQYGRVLKKDELEPIVAQGCALCDKQGQTWGEFVKVLGKYSGYHTPYICADCYNNEEAYEIIKYAV